MTGISSRTGYTRRQVTHFKPDPSLSSSTRVLQIGQTRMSRAYFGIAFVSPSGFRAFDRVNWHCIKRRPARATPWDPTHAGHGEMIIPKIPQNPRPASGSGKATGRIARRGTESGSPDLLVPLNARRQNKCAAI